MRAFEHRFSLRARATSWYVGLLAVALIVFSTGIYVGMRTYLRLSLERQLNATAQTIAHDFLNKLVLKGDAWVLGELRESYSNTAIDHFVRLSVGSQVLFSVADMSSPPVLLNAIPLPGSFVVESHRRQVIGGNDVLVYTLPFRAADGRVYAIEAGATMASMERTLRSLLNILCLASVLILVVAAIGGYWLMKLPLRPLVVLTEKAAKIGRKELGERLPVIPTGDELEGLTHSLNGMIDRLEDALNHNYRFSADASHELRTPLTIMRGELEEVLRVQTLSPEAATNLVSTLEEIDRMSRIVNSLMVITRLDGGGERMDLEVLDLAALARTIVEHMQLLAEEKGLRLGCSAPRPVLVRADRVRMKQVVVNLVDNAIKYTNPPSSATPGSTAVHVSVFSVGPSANLEIVDHGIGILDQSLPFVFDRFYRVDAARNRGTGGVGLGLAIVKSIVTAHDGSVSIKSVIGQGSTVLVQVPLASVTSGFASPESPATTTWDRRQPQSQTNIKPTL